MFGNAAWYCAGLPVLLIGFKLKLWPSGSHKLLKAITCRYDYAQSGYTYSPFELKSINQSTVCYCTYSWIGINHSSTLLITRNACFLAKEPNRSIVSSDNLWKILHNTHCICLIWIEKKLTFTNWIWGWRPLQPSQWIVVAGKFQCNFFASNTAVFFPRSVAPFLPPFCHSPRQPAQFNMEEISLCSFVGCQTKDSN